MSWEKIKNFCTINFSQKVLKWRKCNLRITLKTYVTLKKLSTLPQKIHKFSYGKPRFLPQIRLFFMNIRKLNFSDQVVVYLPTTYFKTIFTKADLRMYVLLRSKNIIYLEFKNI